MAFHNVQLDPTISYGTSGGPSFRTTLQTTASGHEYRVARQAQGRHRFKFAKELMTGTEWAGLIEFMLERRGHLHGFRFKDHRDYTTGTDGTGAVTDLDVLIGTGDATVNTFQLFKQYGIGGVNPYIRTISLPVAGTLQVAINAAPTSLYTVTNPGGKITFDTPPAGSAAITAGFEFDVPVRFSLPDEQLEVVLTQGLLAASDLACVELLDEEETPELWYPGGSEPTIVTANDYAVTFQTELWPFDVTVAAINVWLPAPDRLPGGPRILTIHNVAASSGTIQILDDAGAAVGSTFASGVTKRVALLRAGSSATWITY